MTGDSAVRRRGEWIGELRRVHWSILVALFIFVTTSLAYGAVAARTLGGTVVLAVSAVGGVVTLTRLVVVRLGKRARS
jgi:hypothetical protein